MLKKNTIQAYARWEVTPSEIAQRQEKKLWSNCVSVELVSFMEEWKVIRVIVKKSRLGEERLEETREEYRKLRHHLWDIVPLQAFITEKCTEGSDRQLISAFCSPVTIAYDIFGSEENFEFFKWELERSAELQDDLELFIRWYRSLVREWFIIDLWWDENLIVTREWRLKYIDSFIINMAQRKSLRPVSEKRFSDLAELSIIKRWKM